MSVYFRRVRLCGFHEPDMDFLVFVLVIRVLRWNKVNFVFPIRS